MILSLSLLKAKTRIYDKEYVALGFTVTKVRDEERPVCLLCLKMLAADSMKPNILSRHLKTLHHVVKPQNTANNRPRVGGGECLLPPSGDRK